MERCSCDCGCQARVDAPGYFCHECVRFCITEKSNGAQPRPGFSLVAATVFVLLSGLIALAVIWLFMLLVYAAEGWQIGF